MSQRHADGRLCDLWLCSYLNFLVIFTSTGPSRRTWRCRFCRSRTIVRSAALGGTTVSGRRTVFGWAIMFSRNTVPGRRIVFGWAIEFSRNTSRLLRARGASRFFRRNKPSDKLIHFYRVDTPIPVSFVSHFLNPMLKGDLRLHECFGILSDKFVASHRLLSTHRIRRPSRSSPISTKCRVEYDLMVPEMSVYITALEVGLRFSPTCRIRIPIRDIGRNRGPRKEPDTDKGWGPLGSIDSAGIGVEGWAIGEWRWGFGAAPIVTFSSQPCVSEILPVNFPKKFRSKRINSRRTALLDTPKKFTKGGLASKNGRLTQHYSQRPRYNLL